MIADRFWQEISEMFGSCSECEGVRISPPSLVQLLKQPQQTAASKE